MGPTGRALYTYTVWESAVYLYICIYIFVYNFIYIYMCMCFVTERQEREVERDRKRVKEVRERGHRLLQSSPQKNKLHY